MTFEPTGGRTPQKSQGRVANTLLRPTVYFAIFNITHSLFSDRYSFDQANKDGSLVDSNRDSNPDPLGEAATVSIRPHIQNGQIKASSIVIDKYIKLFSL